MKPALDEMVTKGVLVHWELVRGLFGWEFSFYHSLKFFARYYGDLDGESKKAVEKALPEFRVRDDFKAKVEAFKERSGVKEDDEVTRGYFERYLALTMDTGG